jgi:transcription termination/antitermination factor NusG
MSKEMNKEVIEDAAADEEALEEVTLEAEDGDVVADSGEAQDAEQAGETGQADAPALEDDGRAWYVVQDKIFDVVVPTEEEIEIKDGKRRTVERRVFPGYILVQLIMDEDSWYVVRNTPGVTGFVGMGNEPTPLRPDEVAKIMNRMEAEAPKVKFNFQPGEKVRIRSGPFSDFIGTVDEIDIERAKVKVLVSFFGRETPVELDFLHVENV